MTTEQNTAYAQHLNRFADKMAAAGAPDPVIDMFKICYQRIVEGESGLLPEADISPVKPDELPVAEDLSPRAATGRQSLDKTVMIKLNGGLGTSMGLTRPKSLIKVKQGYTFLDIILRQAAGDDPYGRGPCQLHDVPQRQDAGDEGGAR